MPLVDRHEVQIADRRGIDGGPDGGKAGTGDGAGWQAHPPVCVEGRLHQEVVAREALALLADGVLSRGVRLQRHVEPDPVPENGRDQGHLARVHRFLLDDRGQREQPVEAQVPRARRGEDVRRDALAHPRHHPREDLVGRHPLHELVAVGEQVALKGISRYVERPQEQSVPGGAHDVVRPGQAFGGELAGQFRHRGALAQDHVVLQDVARLEHGEHRHRVGSAGDLVLSRLEAPHAPAHECQECEAHRAADHAGLAEDSSDIQEAPVGGDLHDPGTRADRDARGQDPPGLEPHEQQAAGHEKAEHRPGPERGMRWLRPVRGESGLLSHKLLFCLRFWIQSTNPARTPRLCSWSVSGLCVSGIIGGLGPAGPTSLPGGIPCSS